MFRPKQHKHHKSPWSTQHEVGGPFDQIPSCQVFELHTQHLVHLPYRQKQILGNQNVKNQSRKISVM